MGQAIETPPAFDAKVAELEAAGWYQHAMPVPPFVELIGPIWELPTETGGRYGFLAQHKHSNRRDVTHGGMLMAFTDHVLGRTARRANGDQPQATIQFDFKFLGPVRAGDFVEIDCRVVLKTRFVIFMSGVLTADSRNVATASGLWKILGNAPLRDMK